MKRKKHLRDNENTPLFFPQIHFSLIQPELFALNATQRIISIQIHECMVFYLFFCSLSVVYFLFTLLERFAFNAELLLIFHGKLLLLQLCVIRNVRLNAYTIFAVDDDFFLFLKYSRLAFFAYS